MKKEEEERAEKLYTLIFKGIASPEDVDKFVGWVKKDVKKESVVFLEANSMEWNPWMTLEVTERASFWFNSQLK
jgi:hypothetical protein